MTRRETLARLVRELERTVDPKTREAILADLALLAG